MTKSDKKAVDSLNELIEVCEDGAKGFESAAGGVKDSSLRTLLEQLSNERYHYVADLQAEVRGLGGEAEEKGSTVGALHRGWIGLKAAVTGRDDRAILVECERGEDTAKEAFKKAVDGAELPGTVLPIVQRQLVQIEVDHDRIKALRDRQTASSHR